LRSAWQKHRRVAYVVSGSARGLMTDLVASSRSPFFGHFALLEIDAFADADAICLAPPRYGLQDLLPPLRRFPSAELVADTPLDGPPLGRLLERGGAALHLGG
jgi:hypothetical protein